MLPSTLDMVPSPSTWNPRPSTLDKKIDSLLSAGFGFDFLLNLGLVDVKKPSNCGMFAFSAASLTKSANLRKVG